MMYPKLLSTILAVSFVGIAHSAMAAERFSVEAWGQSLNSALKSNKASEIAPLLDMKALRAQALPACTDCTAKENMKQARDLFENKKYEEALDLYNKIPKNADYWFQAVEEKGWAYFRQGDFQKSLAQTKTLLSPQFGEVVASESYFLQSLTQLRLCDYKAVLETHAIFKEKQKSRIVEVQALTETGMNEAFAKVINKTDKFPLVGTEIAESLLHLPGLYFKDQELQTQLLNYKVADKAIAVLNQNGSAMPKLQNSLDKVKQDSFAKLKNRMMVLAQIETKENQKILSKLNLIEVETIQRIHTDMRWSESLYKKGQFKKTDEDQLVFMDDGRPWIDELDKYEVTAKACPQNIRRKM